MAAAERSVDNFDHEAGAPSHKSRDSAAWGWLGW
jgi:hypothetical protein